MNSQQKSTFKKLFSMFFSILFILAGIFGIKTEKKIEKITAKEPLTRKQKRNRSSSSSPDRDDRLSRRGTRISSDDSASDDHQTRGQEKMEGNSKMDDSLIAPLIDLSGAHSNSQSLSSSEESSDTEISEEANWAKNLTATDSTKPERENPKTSPNIGELETKTGETIMNNMGGNKIRNPLQLLDESLYPIQAIESMMKDTEGKGLTFGEMKSKEIGTDAFTQFIRGQPNIQIPKKIKSIQYCDSFFYYAGKKLKKHGIMSTEKIIKDVRKLFEKKGPLKANPEDFVVMKDKKLLCRFTTPINLVSERTKADKMEWTLSPILDMDTSSAIDFRPIGFKTETSMERTKQQIRKIFLKRKMLDIGIDSIRTELNWDKTDQSHGKKKIKKMDEIDLKHFDMENFFVETNTLEFPFRFELGNLSKHLWNRTIFLLILQETIISLKQKYSLLKQVRKLNKKNRDIKFDETKNEFYVEVTRSHVQYDGDKKRVTQRKERKALLGLESGLIHTDRNESDIYFGDKKFDNELTGVAAKLKKRINDSMKLEYTNYIEEDARIREKFHLPPGTAFISMEFGNLQCVVMQAPHSDVYNYSFNILDSPVNPTSVIHNLGSFLIKKDKVSEVLQNSTLLFTYSLFINEACAEFPGFLMYGLNPTPEYANELSCLWMVQNSTETVYKKYSEIILDKFEEPLNHVHTLKRIYSALRVTSTSNDIYFSEIAFARPDLKGERYFMEAVKKMRQDSGLSSEEVMENYRKFKHYFDIIPAVVPSENSIKELDMKSSAHDFTGPNSSAMTRYNEKLSDNVFIVIPSNYSSSGTMTALASGASSRTQGSFGNVLLERKNAKEKFEAETQSELLDTSVFNLCVQSIGEPDETTVFVKSQTQGVRGITVTKPNTKFKTQFAESLVRPLCHEEKENLILDVDKRAERIIEMTRNVRKQVLENSGSRVESFALDLKNFNTFICLDFMAEIVSKKMESAGYSKKSIESYKELILSYKNKRIQIRLSTIRKSYEAWRYKYMKTGHYHKKISKLEKKMREEPLMAKKEHCEQRREKLIQKTEKILEDCDQDLFKHFETIAKSNIGLKKDEEYAIVLDQEWGMFQGILGCSATLMMTEIYKCFLLNYKFVKNHNFDFICMSDDANIIVELDNQCPSKKFLEDLNEFMSMFGPRLNMMKCGTSATTDVWFNSNKWSPLLVNTDAFNTYYRKVFSLDGVMLEELPSVFYTKKSVEVRHLSRYLKLFFKDDLSVNYLEELHTKTSNYQYLLPFFEMQVPVSAIQTMTSLSSFLIRSTPLFGDTMDKCDPEQNYFFPSHIPIGPKCFSNPVFSKMIRSEYTNMIPDRRRGLKYMYPEYSSIRKSEKFNDTLKKVTADKKGLTERVDMCDFISSIVKSGDSEDRSPEILLKTLYQPFCSCKVEEKRWRSRIMGRTKLIYPMKKWLMEEIDADICSMYYVFETLKKRSYLPELRYFNFGKKSEFEPPSYTNLEYMLKGTEMVINFDRYVSEASLFESKKEIEVPLPSDQFCGFDPDVLEDGDRVGTILTLLNPPSTWSCPQESRGKAWIHEGLFIKEFYVDVGKKLRFIFSLLDNSIISQSAMIIEEEETSDDGYSLTIVKDKRLESIMEAWRSERSVLAKYEKLPLLTQENLWMSEYYWFGDRFISSLPKRKERYLTTTANARRLYVMKHDDKALPEYERTTKYGKIDYWKAEDPDLDEF